MLVTPHKLYLSQKQELKKYIDQTVSPSTRFVIGFKNSLTKDLQFILIKQQNKMALAHCFQLKHEIANYLYYKQQLQKFNKLSEEQKKQQPLPQQQQPPIYRQFQNFIQENKLNSIQYLCNTVIVSEDSQKYIPTNSLTNEQLTKLRQQFQGVTTQVMNNILINLFDTLQQLQKSGLMELMQKNQKSKLSKQQLNKIQTNLQRFKGDELKRIPKVNPENGEWGEMGNIEIKKSINI